MHRKSGSTQTESRFEDAQTAIDFCKVADEVRDILMVVRRDRTIRYCNSAAADLLSRREPFRIVRGRLHCTTDAAEAKLGRAIDTICAAQKVQLCQVAFRDRHIPPLVVAVTCIPGGEDDDVLIKSSDSRGDPGRAIGPLQQCFGLTNAEAIVAISIAEGLSIGEIAAQRSVAADTIRSQLKTVAAKLGCTRQTQIAAIVHRMPVAS